MRHHVVASLLIAVVGAAAGTVLQAQTVSRGLTLEVLLFERPVENQPTRLWMKITNNTGGTRVLCRSARGYTWLSDDPQKPTAIEMSASIHGCGDDDHDPFWLLLPGESRFDSFEVARPPGGDALLEVGLLVTHFPVGGSIPRESEDLGVEGNSRQGDRAWGATASPRKTRSVVRSLGVSVPRWFVSARVAA